MDWPVVKLADLCDILDNLRKPITKKDRVEGPYPYYGATGILSYVDDFIFDEKLVLVGEDGAKWGAGENSAFKIDGKAWVNNHAHVVRPLREKLLDQWLIYYLNGQDLSDFITGMTVPKLNQGKLKEIPIPLPSLYEQKRIVAILDQAFADLEQVRAKTEQNLKNARELFDSYLQKLCIGNEMSWIKCQVGDVCDLWQGLAINKKTKHLLVEKSSLPLLRIKDLKYKTSEQYVVEDGFPKNALVSEDEIIYTRTGQVGLVFRGFKGVLHNNSFKVSPNEQIDKSYLFWWLQHNSFKNEIIKLSSKAAQPDISHTSFNKQPISIPPVSYQLRSVIQIEKMNKLSLEVEGIYKKKLFALDELKKSILQKAFSGELTAKAE